MLKQQDTEFRSLGPRKDHFWVAADGTQGGSAARAPFTEPEECRDAASKMTKHLLENITLQKDAKLDQIS